MSMPRPQLDRRQARRERMRLLGDVRTRVQQFGVGHDPATVLALEVVAEVMALLGTAADPATDLKVAHASEWPHWYRGLVLDSGAGEQDHAASLFLFAPVYQVRPDAVPGQLRVYFCFYFYEATFPCPGAYR